MDEKDVIRIPTMEAFNNFRDSLNLTDRQRTVFNLRYSKGLYIIDIATELGTDRKTIQKELKVIKEKLSGISQKPLT